MQTRRDLALGDLGAIGADAIRQTLLNQDVAKVPSVRTINRILGRRGALDGRKRTRRPPPPTGWYLPDVAQTLAELDSIDIVEGLVIKGGPHVEVLNAVSLHGGLTASWPVESPVTSELDYPVAGLSSLACGRFAGLCSDSTTIRSSTARIVTLDALGRGHPAVP